MITNNRVGLACGAMVLAVVGWLASAALANAQSLQAQQQQNKKNPPAKDAPPKNNKDGNASKSTPKDSNNSKGTGKDGNASKNINNPPKKDNNNSGGTNNKGGNTTNPPTINPVPSFSGFGRYSYAPAGEPGIYTINGKNPSHGQPLPQPIVIYPQPYPVYPNPYLTPNVYANPLTYDLQTLRYLQLLQQQQLAYNSYQTNPYLMNPYALQPFGQISPYDTSLFNPLLGYRPQALPTAGDPLGGFGSFAPGLGSLGYR